MSGIDRNNIASADEKGEGLIIWDRGIKVFYNPMPLGNILLAFGLPIIGLGSLSATCLPNSINSALPYQSGPRD